jgi:hypothetical protein
VIEVDLQESLWACVRRAGDAYRDYLDDEWERLIGLGRVPNRIDEDSDPLTARIFSGSILLATVHAYIERGRFVVELQRYDANGRPGTTMATFVDVTCEPAKEQR